MIPPAHAPAFLAAHGWGDAQILPLAGDASFRRYFRVIDGGRQAVLMDAPPPHEDPAPFLRAARWLDANGMRPPRILADQRQQGDLSAEQSLRTGDDRFEFRLGGRVENVQAIEHCKAARFVGSGDGTEGVIHLGHFAG